MSIPPHSSRSRSRAMTIFSIVPFFLHPWKRQWQVWYDGYRSGKSCQRASVFNIHMIPFSIGRGSVRSLPRPFSLGFGSFINGRSISHWSSVISIFVPLHMRKRWPIPNRSTGTKYLSGYYT